MLTRRRLLTSASALLAAPILTAFTTPAFAQTARVPLAHPALTESVETDGRRRFDLTVAPGETEFFPGIKTRTIGINQPYLGPVNKETLSCAIWQLTI